MMPENKDGNKMANTKSGFDSTMMKTTQMTSGENKLKQSKFATQQSFFSVKNQQQSKDTVYEKDFTRSAYIKNLIRGVNEFPRPQEGRPLVKGVKKRVSLLLKGQSADRSLSIGSDHQTIYSKAQENLSGEVASPTNRNEHS